MSVLTRARTDPQPTEVSLVRLHAMRAGYLLMAVGLVLVKWPLLPKAHTLPLYEGVTLCWLTAMSVLAFIALRHPVKLVPLLVLESLWKVLWLSLVALPRLASRDMDTAASQVAFNCLFVIPIIAVTPWRYVWRTYVASTGERWR